MKLRKTQNCYCVSAREKTTDDSTIVKDRKKYLFQSAVSLHFQSKRVILLKLLQHVFEDGNALPRTPHQIKTPKKPECCSSLPPYTSSTHLKEGSRVAKPSLECEDLDFPWVQLLYSKNFC